jgi:hypothetical protein
MASPQGYAKVGPELLEMADEGLVLAARAKARLGQALSAAQHIEGHLQVVGVGDWQPTSTCPFVDRRASPHSGGRLVAAALAGMHDTTALFTNFA